MEEPTEEVGVDDVGIGVDELELADELLLVDVG